MFVKTSAGGENYCEKFGLAYNKPLDFFASF